jgi:FkbM family methyltransferase
MKRRILEISHRLADRLLSGATRDPAPAQPETAKQTEVISNNMSPMDIQTTSLLLDRVRERVDFPIPDWWERSFWEPTVALAIRDHVRPGDIAFDVGSNAAALAVQMSRLVGPRGKVCAFEASPRILPRTQYNLVHAGCFNTTLYHRAVWRSTGSMVNIAYGTYLNDRIDPNAPDTSVLTLALDDFVSASGLRPTFIKMDIEGAEFDALAGMTRLLQDVRPVLVLEQTPEDMRCHAILVAAGYTAVDLASYRRIRSASDFLTDTGVVNVLFLPNERTAGSPYIDSAIETVVTVPAERFNISDSGDISLREPIPLSRGRFIVRGDFTADGEDNEVFAGVEVDGAPIFRYHTNTKFMANSYRDWVIHLDGPTRIAPYLRFRRGSDPTLRWRGVTIARVLKFDTLTGPVVF